jgi:hypothetical protein
LRLLLLDRSSDSLYLLSIYLHFYTTLIFSAYLSFIACSTMFPAICVAAFSIDLIFASSQIIESGSVGREYQGVAGSLVGRLLTYGLSTGLGFAGTIEVYTNRGGEDTLRGYRSAVFFAVELAAMGLIG